MNNLIRSLFFVFILSSAGFLIIPEAHALFGMGDSKAKQGQWSDMPSQGMNRDTQKRMDKMRRESAKRREKIHKTKDKDKKKAAKKLSKKHRENREAQAAQISHGKDGQAHRIRVPKNRAKFRSSLNIFRRAGIQARPSF